MANQKPQKKPQKPKRLNLNTKAAWKEILKQVDKKEVPVSVLEKMMIHLRDGTIVTVDIKRMVSEGADPDDIETHINQRLIELDMYIEDVNYFLDIDLVEKTIQPETDRLLAKL